MPPKATGALLYSDCSKHLQGNPIVYFDIQLGRYGDAVDVGRVVIELKQNVTPRTAENFRELCLTKPGAGYAGSRFHRVIPSFMVQVRRPIISWEPTPINK